MTPQISTDPSQSKRLLDCGVNPETSDMTWVTVKSPNIEGKTDVLMAERLLKFDDPPKMPSWSLSALLAMLPPYIEDDRSEEGKDPIRCFLIIFPSENGEVWTVRYANGRNEDSEAVIGRKGRTLIEATVRMMETLVKNRIKLNNQ